ncbi:MAG: hypothetical protein K0R51_2540 [Cytophagaceae bacterium]|jgi:hypothetical protein|nr:hypothetical protein [Cytophagaceae bacterium]
MKYLFTLLLFTPLFLQAQSTEEWNTFKTKQYAINYPASWSLDTSGQGGTKFVLLSASETEEDTFKENVNLIIQDLTGYNLDLNGYTKLSTEQVKTMISNSKILESKKVKQGSTEYHKIIYSGDLQGYHLTFEQYYWVIKNRAYVVTFTAEQTKFKTYQAVGEKILNSFVLTQ